MKPKQFLEKLLNLGTQDESDEQLVFFIQQSNLNGLVWFSLDLLLGTLFCIFLADIYLGVVFLLSAVAFAVTSLGFNYLGWTTLSRISTVSVGSVLVLVCSLYMGELLLAHCALLLGAIFPFTYFKTSEKKSLAICLSIPLLFYFFLEVVNFDLGPKIGEVSETSELALKLIFYIVTFLGIVTNAYSAVVKLDAKAKELKESESYLRLLFKTFTHDIGNPLAVMNLLSDQGGKAKNLNEVQIQRLGRATSQMVEIHSKLKQLSFLMSNKFQLDIRDNDIVTMIESSVDCVQHLIEKKNIEVVIVDKLSYKEVKVQVDRSVMIYQVLVNFLSNAIKFSFEGSKIEISIDIVDGAYCVVSIKDQGQGIDSKIMPSLFSWEKLTSQKGTHGEKGTGLGLPIAKRFLEIMGSRLSIQSISKSENELNHGTTVSLSLLLSKSQKNETPDVA